MERCISRKLRDWSLSAVRKPLILRGARQVGKTWLLREFGKSDFERLFYVNFEKQSDLHTVFERDLDPTRILAEIGLILQGRVTDKDLLVFDEIQACPRALTSLKYFCEDKPEIRICAAGSLLGLELSPSSYPVGKVDIQEVPPLTFMEFLNAVGRTELADYLVTQPLDEPISLAIHGRIFDQFKNYLCVGGMPEAVLTWSRLQDEGYPSLEQVREKQNSLLMAYVADMAKHSGKQNSMHLERCWRAIPEQLAKQQEKQSKRFIFKDVIPGIRGFERLACTIDWLQKAGLILKTSIVERPEVPLSAYAKESLFKLYVFDTGLLGALADIPPAEIIRYDYGSFKGFFAENFVAQELHAAGVPLFSWREKEWEIEFVTSSTPSVTIRSQHSIESGNAANRSVIPIDVKSGGYRFSASLKNFTTRYSPSCTYALVGEAVNNSRSRNVTCLPIYRAGGLFL